MYSHRPEQHETVKPRASPAQEKELFDIGIIGYGSVLDVRVV